MKEQRSQYYCRVLGIIVAYKPDAVRLYRLLKALSPQVDEVLIVDNTPLNQRNAWDVRRETGLVPENIRYLCLGENLGIATALNIGLECMLGEGFGYALLSDQDSVPELDMVPSLISVVGQLRSAGKRVASVCPQYVDQNTNMAFPFQVMIPGKRFYSSVSAEQADPWIEILTAISSGCLVTREVVESIGGMKEKLFIDYVDIEWFLRARAYGFQNYGTSATTLAHRLGDGSFSIWTFGWRPYNLYSPERLYYRIRNFILICRLPHVPLRWAVRASWYWIGNLYAYGVFSPNRTRNLKMMARGLLHGILGRSGRYDDDGST